MRGATIFLGIAIITASVKAAAPRSSNRVHEDLDPQSHLKTLTFEAATHSCSNPTTSDESDANVRLIFNAFQTLDNGTQYVLAVDMRGGQFIHPGRRGTLETLTQNTHDELLPADTITKWSSHPWSGGREKHEQIPFGADRIFLEKVAESPTFQFRVNAADHMLERCTDAKELRDLREFLGRAATL